MQINTKPHGETIVKMTKNETDYLRKAQAICNMLDRVNVGDGSGHEDHDDIELMFSSINGIEVEKPY